MHDLLVSGIGAWQTIMFRSPMNREASNVADIL